MALPEQTNGANGVHNGADMNGDGPLVQPVSTAGPQTQINLTGKVIASMFEALCRVKKPR